MEYILQVAFVVSEIKISLLDIIDGSDLLESMGDRGRVTLGI